MFNFSVMELGLVMVIALVVFGPGKLPEVSKALGKGIGEFRRAVTEPVQEEPINVTAKAVESKTEEVK